MIIVANRNIIIPSADGSQAFPVSRGYVGPVPEWVTITAYFKALVKDGKIAVSDTTKDKDIAEAESTEVLDRARDNADKELAEPVDAEPTDAAPVKRARTKKSE